MKVAGAEVKTSRGSFQGRPEAGFWGCLTLKAEMGNGLLSESVIF